jgi:hypothetical protein
MNAFLFFCKWFFVCGLLAIAAFVVVMVLGFVFVFFFEHPVASLWIVGILWAICGAIYLFIQTFRMDGKSI